MEANCQSYLSPSTLFISVYFPYHMFRIVCFMYSNPYAFLESFFTLPLYFQSILPLDWSCLKICPYKSASSHTDASLPIFVMGPSKTFLISHLTNPFKSQQFCITAYLKYFQSSFYVSLLPSWCFYKVLYSSELLTVLF